MRTRSRMCTSLCSDLRLPCASVILWSKSIHFNVCAWLIDETSVALSAQNINHAENLASE